VDDRHTVACVRQAGQRDRFARLRTDVGELRDWLRAERGPDDRLHLTFEVSGRSGHLYDGLIDVVDRLEVSNPSKLTWIYRSAKKNDRIDARKQAVLLSVGELPRVHMPTREVRQWRQTIQHRRRLVQLATQSKNRIRALLKGQGLTRPHRGGWWNRTNREWMQDEAGRCDEPWRFM